MPLPPAVPAPLTEFSTLALGLSLLLLAAVAGLAWWRVERQPSPGSAPPPPLPRNWPLNSRRVLGDAELQAYRRLREDLPDHLVLAKLPLVRFCQPRDRAALDYWYGLLVGQHVSFAICNEAGRVVAAIDLDGLREVSPRSVQLRRAVLEACKVRYLRCKPEALPSRAQLHAFVPGMHSRTVPLARVSLAREHLAATVATRRRERTAFADSQFQTDTGSEPRFDTASGHHHPPAFEPTILEPDEDDLPEAVRNTPFRTATLR